MFEKVKGMIGSIRFWLLTIIALIQIVEVYEIIPAGTAEKVANTIQLLLGGSIVVRTIDKLK